MCIHPGWRTPSYSQHSLRPTRAIMRITNLFAKLHSACESLAAAKPGRYTRTSAALHVLEDAFNAEFQTRRVRTAAGHRWARLPPAVDDQPSAADGQPLAAYRGKRKLGHREIYSMTPERQVRLWRQRCWRLQNEHDITKKALAKHTDGKTSGNRISKE